MTHFAAVMAMHSPHGYFIGCVRQYGDAPYGAVCQSLGIVATWLDHVRQVGWFG